MVTNVKCTKITWKWELYNETNFGVCELNNVEDS